MPLLIDVEALTDECCDQTLDAMAKAISFGAVGHLWDRLANRFAAGLAEAVSSRLSAILQNAQDMLGRLLGGHPDELRRDTSPWLRWDESQFASVRAKLAAMDPATTSIDDLMLMVEFVLNRYLPASVIEGEAEYLAVRAALMGKVQANLETDRRVTDAKIERILDLLPTSFAHVPPRVLTSVETSIMTFGKAHAAENIRGVTSYLRHKFATAVLEHAQAGLIGQKEGTWQHLQTRLFDDLAETNKDMRRIAVTEVGEMVNQGHIAAKTLGERVKRVEAYANTCPFCRSINGLEMEVVAADAPDKDGWRQVWPGKTNVGRSASPMKREGDRLVERPADELWWPAAGVQHPNCRGAWAPVTTRPPNVSAEFFDWMQSTLDAAEAKHPV